MIEGRDSSIAMALAYVDDCLPPSDRLEFERKMAGDPEISDRVQIWLAQNEAIRAAFSESDRRGARARRVGRDFSVRPRDPERASRFIEELRRGAPPIASLRVVARKRPAPVTAAPADPRAALARHLRRAGLVALGALLFLAAGVGPGPRERATRFAGAAVAAYRTYVSDRRQATEVATSDSRTLERWFDPRFYRPIVVPNFAGSGFALVGGRVVPGAEGPAAFAIYMNAEGERIGLMVEPSDSPAISRPVFESSVDIAAVLTVAARDSAALTVVGKKGTSHLAELARFAGAVGSAP
jgi:anti-sigma factor RsiW